MVYAFVVTYVIGWVIDKTIGFRVDEEVEVSGIDQAEHLETAYDNIGGGSTSRERDMKLVTAVIKPHKWEDVREALAPPASRA